LLVEAYEEAIQDADKLKDIQAAWYGTHYDDTSLEKAD